MPGRPTASSRAPATVPLGDGGTAFDHAARLALRFAEHLGDEQHAADPSRLLREARARLDRFADDLGAARVPRAAIAPARLALGLVIDEAARRNRAIPRREWSAGAHRLLYEGEEMSVERLREFAARAEAAGPSFAEVAIFLRASLAWLENSRSHREQVGPDGWGGLLVGAVLGFACLVLAWMIHAEWSFHRDTAQAFAEETVAIGLDRGGEIPDLPARLDRMAAAVRGVDQTLEKAPLHLFAGLLGFDAGKAAHAVQAEAVKRHVPPVLAKAIDTALASEGDSARLYDTLRAWDILSGAAEWSPGFLQGWLTARADLLPDIQDLAPHVALLQSPTSPLPQPDPELLAQARDFAAEAPEADRAWIELIRSPGMTALTPWRPAMEVPELADVVVRRSGLLIETPIPGLYTTRGWTLAQDGGAARAVEMARAEAARMFGTGQADRDSADKVMDRLQLETLATWREFLADLRVRPFDRRETGILVSGLLARRESPLGVLLSQAWAEVGGTDRSRPHGLQLRIAAEFGPAIQYVEEGGLQEISSLFASLNAALGARDANEDLRTERLMTFQGRAASVAALRQAPPVVVQIVEDVLAQTSVSRIEQITNPITQRWQSEVFDLCRKVTEGHFPFAADGDDVDPAAFASLLGPNGAIDRFFQSEAGPYIDTAASPWRWRPEARFSGLSPESAETFEKAQAIQAAFFGPSGTMGTEVTLAALAERGQAEVRLGGVSAAVGATDEAASLHWPGPDPQTGISVTFQPQAAGASVARPGPWGFLRLFGALHLRERDGGRRFLVDIRLEAGRLFLEMSFPSAANPVAGLRLAKGFSCPAAL